MVDSSFEFQGSVAGVDVSDKSSRICVMSEPGEVMLEDTVKNNQDAFRAWFAKFKPLRVVVEAGTHTLWIRDELTALGHDVLIVDPRDPRTQGRKKTDREDARRLAMAGFLPAGYLNTVRFRSRETHRDLMQLRARGALVGTRTTLINCVRGLVKPLGGRIQDCEADNFAQRAAKDLPRELLRIVLPLLRTIRELTRAIAACDRRLSRITAKRYPIAQRFAEEIPGIGPVTSLAFVLTVEDPHRFPKSRTVGAYVGLAPGSGDSGEQRPQLRITKAGDVRLRSLLVQCANSVLHPRSADWDLRSFGLALMEHGGKNARKRAKVAVARRLAVLMHRLWITGEVFDPHHVAKLHQKQAAQMASRPPNRAKTKTAARITAEQSSPSVQSA